MRRRRKLREIAQSVLENILVEPTQQAAQTQTNARERATSLLCSPCKLQLARRDLLQQVPVRLRVLDGFHREPSKTTVHQRLTAPAHKQTHALFLNLRYTMGGKADGEKRKEGLYFLTQDGERVTFFHGTSTRFCAWFGSNFSAMIWFVYGGGTSWRYGEECKSKV